QVDLARLLARLALQPALDDRPTPTSDALAAEDPPTGLALQPLVSALRVPLLSARIDERRADRQQHARLVPVARREQVFEIHPYLVTEGIAPQHAVIDRP